MMIAPAPRDLASRGNLPARVREVLVPGERAAVWLALAAWFPFLLLIVYYRAKATFPPPVRYVYFPFDDKRYDTAEYLLGVVAPVIWLVTAAYAVHGQLGEFIQQYLLFPRAVAAGANDTPWGGFTHGKSSPLPPYTRLYTKLPFLLADLALLTAVRVCPLRIATEWSRPPPWPCSPRHSHCCPMRRSRGTACGSGPRRRTLTASGWQPLIPPGC